MTIPVGTIYRGQQVATLARAEARGDIPKPGQPWILRIGKIVGQEAEGGGYQVNLLADDGTVSQGVTGPQGNQGPQTGFCAYTQRDIHVQPPTTTALAVGDLVWLVRFPGTSDYVILNSSGAAPVSAIDNIGMVTE